MNTICLPDQLPPVPWNKGKLIGLKPQLGVREAWLIRIRLQIAENKCDLALFNLAIEGKVQGCDLVQAPGGHRQMHTLK